MNGCKWISEGLKTMKLGTLGACAMLALPAVAAIEPATLINDNMVLQRDRSVPIWGRATAGNEIRVSFSGQTKRTVVAADGTWRVELEPMAAGEVKEK